MNVKLLIDQVVRQTTVLIAQLATSAGLRAPLAHIANQVFLELAQELEGQGVSRKVAADMFGLALRSYQGKVQRLQARQGDDEQRSLWEAVLEEIRHQGVISRADLLAHFWQEDETVLRGIVRDLVDSGLVFQNGRGHGTVYRIADDEDLATIIDAQGGGDLAPLVWIGIYLHGPIAAGPLAEVLGLSPGEVLTAAEALVEEGRAREQGGEAGERLFSSEVCVIPVGDVVGWEAALFDHFSAVVTALGIKLRQLQIRSLPQDVVGGSTYSFQIWEEHPFEERVLGLLRSTRRELSALRAEVDRYNATQPQDGPPRRKVTFYFGQSVIDAEVEEEEHPRA